MTSLEAILRRIGTDLTEAGVSFALIGGLAVAKTGHLMALKVLSRDDTTRPQDLVDLRALLDTASAADLALARHALESIAARGYARGRDLVAAMNGLLAT